VATDAAAAPLPPPEAPAGQIGLFDAQVGRLRAALDAIARADLAVAVSLLGGVAPELDPRVPSLLHRGAELHRVLVRARGMPPRARSAAQLDLGRALATEAAPWSLLGRTLIARAAIDLAPTQGVLAGRLLLEAGEAEEAKSVLLGVPGRPGAEALFTLGDVEAVLGDRVASRRHYRDALLLDPFDGAFDRVADEDVRGLPSLAELEAEVEGDPRAWCAPVGIIAGVLARPREPLGDRPLPAGASADGALARARDFVDALVSVGSPHVPADRDAVIEARRRMKRASAPLFAWYMARQSGSS
jgi:hypothetical protein